jgi:hypothetical protein
MTEKDNKISESLEPPEKDFTIRCPRLGHEVTFPYCRNENNELPCFKTLDCWYSHFNVLAYLKDRLDPEEFKKIFLKKTEPKVLSLMELIDQAKKRS